MPPDTTDDLLPHYMAELAYVRTAGAAFAHKYPRVAAALDLSSDISSDPQVQRLIESFAFLTARLQRTYDAQFPEIPEALLSVLYPQLVAPVPSMAIAQFQTDPEQSRSVAGVTIPAGTMLFANAESTRSAAAADGMTCRFRTGTATTLWPVEVADARLEPRALYPLLDTMPEVQGVLRIRLRCLGNRRFGEFAPASLRFFLSPRNGGRGLIYELLFAHLRCIAVGQMAHGAIPPDGPAADPVLCDAQLKMVGFEANEALLPCPAMSHQAYRLLQEYFTFPDKFLFFDVAALADRALGEGTHADLLLLLSAAPRHPVLVNAETFVLGCAPIVNLFPRVTEPIRLDHTKLEYRLVPDSRWESTTEIHSIDRVTRSVAEADRAQTIRPLFSLRHADGVGDGAMMYWARRRAVANPSFDGGDMLLSFVDPNLDPALPAADTVFAHVTCTNRGLAEQVAAGTPMNLEVDLPLRAVTCLTRPSRQRPPPAAGSALWRLVSHLSVNHLSFTGGADGAAALREILLLYSPVGDAASARKIGGLVDLSTRRVARRLGMEAWRGFCRGFEVELAFDESAFVGESAYLMGAVLSRFFGLHVAVNAFAELVMKGRQREEAWRWPAQTGETTLL